MKFSKLLQFPKNWNALLTVTVQCWYQCIIKAVNNKADQVYHSSHTSLLIYLHFLHYCTNGLETQQKSGVYQLVVRVRYLPFETAWQVYLPYQQTITPNSVNTKSKCVCLSPTLENYENAQSWLISKGSCCSTEIH